MKQVLGVGGIENELFLLGRIGSKKYD